MHRCSPLALQALMGIVFMASSAWSFSIKPGVQVLTAKAGESREVSFEVVNDESDPLSVSCQLRDSFVLPENKGIDVHSWIEPTFKTIEVPAKSSKTATFTLKVPTQATGEIAGLISFSPEVKEDPKAKKTGMQTKIVTLITVSLYVRIEGTTKGECDLGAVQIENLPQQGTRAPAVKISIGVKNTGNVHQRPRGEFSVYKKGSASPLLTAAFS